MHKEEIRITITREINGEQVEIELTLDEMLEVSKSVDKRNIECDVRAAIERNEIALTDEQIQEVVDELAEAKEQSEYMGIGFCWSEDAILQTIEDFGYMEEDEA